MVEHARVGTRMVVVVATLALAAAPAASQTHRVALGITGGWSGYGDLTPGLATSAVFESGWLAGGQVEGWLGAGRFGVRLNGSYAQRSLEGETESKYELLAGDLTLMVRPLPAGLVPWAAPYLALGGGAARFRGSDGLGPVGGGAYGPDPVTRPIAVAAAGADLAPGSRFGLRLEIADQVVFPSAGDSPPTEGLPITHNVRVLSALQYRIGGARPARIAVAALPSNPVDREPRSAGPAAAERDAEVERLKRELEAREREIERLRGAADAGNEQASVEPPAQARAAVAAAPKGQPTAEAPDPQRAPAGAAPDPDARFTVQVGSFVEPATAQLWVDRLRQRGLPVWTQEVDLQGLQVVRVRVGATSLKADAEALARALGRDGWSVRVNPIVPEDRPPGEAVEQTRQFLSGR